MLIGGLGLFLYGMDGMSRGLQRIAGDKLKTILQTLTKNRFVGVITGAITTSIVQSSSITTVMVVSFVNAGLMTLLQAIPIIIGANIGTTITAQIIAFRIDSLSLPIIAAGAFLLLFSRKEKAKAIGETIFSFGTLFYGLFLMSSAFKPLGADGTLQEFFTRFADQPLLGIAIGLIVTTIVQSSSLTIGIAIAIAQNGIITFEQSIPLIIGINIGSTITANIAAITGSYVAKQAARAHFLINIIGALIALIFIHQFQKLTISISPDAGASRLIANAHTFFNIFTAILVIPFISYISKATKYLIIGKLEKSDELIYLEESSLADPTTAMDQVNRALIDMHSLITNYTKKISITLVTNNKIEATDLLRVGATVKNYEKKLTTYLQKLGEKKLTNNQSLSLSLSIRVLHELTRMNEYAVHMSEIIQEKNRNDIHFTTTEKRDLKPVFKSILNIMKYTHSLLSKNELITTESIITLYEELRTLRDATRSKSNLLYSKHKTTLQAMQSYIDILNALEEIGKKCRNIAETLRVA